MMNDMDILAIIPARAGSTRVPEKNLQLIGGIALWELALRHARHFTEHVIVSTDIQEILDTCRYAERRPPELCNDHISSQTVWQYHCARHYDKWDVALLFQPSSPLRMLIDTQKCIEAVVHPGQADSACVVSRVPPSHRPEKLVDIGEASEGVTWLYLDPDSTPYRGNATRNGCCWAANKAGLWAPYYRCAAVVSEVVQVNIDEPWELEQARKLWKDHPSSLEATLSPGQPYSG